MTRCLLDVCAVPHERRTRTFGGKSWGTYDRAASAIRPDATAAPRIDQSASDTFVSAR
jgi:hypothetical protein